MAGRGSGRSDWLAGPPRRQSVRPTAHPRFPLGIFLVNVAGCFIIGVIAGAIASARLSLSQAGREFVFVGVLGGFTTFSAFGLDTFTLARTSPALAVWNVVAQVAGGLAAGWMGYHNGARSS